MLIYYSLIDAAKNGIEIHPQKYVESAYNCKVISFEGHPISDGVLMGLDKEVKIKESFIEVK